MINQPYQTYQCSGIISGFFPNIPLEILAGELSQLLNMCFFPLPQTITREKNEIIIWCHHIEQTLDFQNNLCKK